MARNTNNDRISRRVFLKHLTALGGLSISLAACGSSTSNNSQSAKSSKGATRSSRQVKLSFWKSPHSQSELQVWKPILNEFEKQHPNIQVSHQVIPWDNLDQKFTAAFTSGQPPDVFYLPDTWIPKYGSQGQLVDLTPMVSGIKKRYVSSFWESAIYKGKAYGIPFLGVVQALLLNMSMFQNAGISKPRSWEEIRSAAKQLTDTSKGTYGININSQNVMVPLLKTGGAKPFSNDLRKVTANTPGGVKAWTVAYQQIGAEDDSQVPTSFTPDQITNLQLKGRIGIMWAEESAIVQEFQKQAPHMKLDVIPLPKVDGTDGKDAVYSSVGYMCMAKSTQHTNEATQLLKFLISKQVQQQYVVDGVNLIPGMNGVKKQNQNPVVAKFLSYLDLAIGEVTSVHWAQAKQSLLEESQAVMTGNKTAEQALTDFKNDTGSILDGS